MSFVDYGLFVIVLVEFVDRLESDTGDRLMARSVDVAQWLDELCPELEGSSWASTGKPVLSLEKVARRWRLPGVIDVSARSGLWQYCDGWLGMSTKEFDEYMDEHDELPFRSLLTFSCEVHVVPGGFALIWFVRMGSELAAGLGAPRLEALAESVIPDHSAWVVYAGPEWKTNPLGSMLAKPWEWDWEPWTLRPELVGWTTWFLDSFAFDGSALRPPASVETDGNRVVVRSGADPQDYEAVFDFRELLFGKGCHEQVPHA